MPPLSLLYCYTIVKQHELDVRLIDAVYLRQNLETITASLAGTDFLLAHTSGYTYDFDRQALVTLHEFLPKATFFIFGNLTGSQALELTDSGAADFVTTCDPEDVLAETLDKLVGPGQLAASVNGLYTKENRTPEQRPWPDIDTLPIPDRQPVRTYRYLNLLAQEMQWTSALLSRGCPFHCTFCNTPGYYKRQVRQRSLENTMEELRYLASLGYREIFFRDDLFYGGRMDAFCDRLLTENIKLRWCCNLRVDGLSYATLEKMERAGCHTIKFGVESGNDRILEEMGKPPTAVALETFRNCRRLGIRTVAHLLIGFPGETEAQMKETVAFIRELEPYVFGLGHVTPHYGSALFAELCAEGRMTGGEWKEAIRGNLSQVDDETLRKVVRMAYIRSYLSPRRLLRYAQDIHQWRNLFRVAGQMARYFS